MGRFASRRQRSRWSTLIASGILGGILLGIFIKIVNMPYIETVYAENRTIEPREVRIEVVNVKLEKYIESGEQELAVREYFKDIPVMIEVARCESTFVHHRDDGSVLSGYIDSDDTGVMQINKRYHLKTATALNLDLNDFKDNMEFARHLYNEQGLQPWSASKPCWSK